MVKGLIVETQTPKGISVEGLEAAGVLTVSGGQSRFKDPAVAFFNDLPDEEAQAWARKMFAEPTKGWENPITYMGWRDIPSHYVVCGEDHVIPAQLQEHMAQVAGSTVVKMDTGHFPYLSQPEATVRVIQQIAESIG